MSTEIQTPEAELEPTLPLVVESNGVSAEASAASDEVLAAPPKVKLKKKDKPTEDGATEGDGEKPANKVSKPIRDVRLIGDQSIKDFVESLPTDGSFKIWLYRRDPETLIDPATGRSVPCAGFLATYTQPVDEPFLLQRYGGGKYELIIKRKDERGSYVYAAARTLVIGGEPLPSALPRNQPSTAAAAAAPAAPENQGVVKELLGMVKDQVAKAENRLPGGDDTSRVIFERMLDQRTQELVDLRRELAEIRNHKPEQDPFKDSILNKFMADDGARAQAMRIAHEAEIRAIKEGQAQHEARLHDRAERDRDQMQRSHDRELSNVKASNDLALAALKQSMDMQIVLLKDEARRLEKSNDELRVEVKDLRAKKEKTLVEQAKDLREIKEALSVDDDEKDPSISGKIMDVIGNPATMEFAQGLISRAKGGPPAQQAVQMPRPMQHPRAQVRPQIVKDPNSGQAFIQRGNQLQPVRRRGPVTEDGTEMPHVDPDSVRNAISVLEAAFSNGTEPELVAQSAKSMMPPELIAAIRDHGVDAFLAKIARIPAESPLSAQDGRNWVRKVGKALVGE